jgi:hypothetical protein
LYPSDKTIINTYARPTYIHALTLKHTFPNQSVESFYDRSLVAYGPYQVSNPGPGLDDNVPEDGDPEHGRDLGQI